MSFNDLPYISTKYEEHDCNLNCDCLKKYKPNVIEEKDKRLENWDEWMKERKHVHKQIGKNVNRSPDKLVQNMFEDYRGLEERKLVLEYSKIPAPLDKYRGNPAFWKMPTSLSKQCGEDQTYYSVMSKAEKCEIPLIEYVHIPGHIKKEKEAVCSRNANDLTKLKYYQEKYMDEKIKLIEPHKPDLDNLVVVGKALRIEDSLEPTPDPSETMSIKEEVLEKPAEIKCLLILNEKSIYDNDSGEIGISIIFHDALCSSLSTQCLHMENKSNYCLRFHFTKHEEPTKMKDLSYLNTSSPQVIYFNKNIHLIQPGEKIDFPFWFKSYKFGYHKEAFAINIIPDLWKNLKIVIKLVSNLSGNDIQKQYKIVQRLENQVRQRVIAEALEDMTRNIPKQFPEAQIYTYDRATIFEALNSTYDPITFRPRYYYDKNIVDELETFYENVKLEKHADTWDYKLETLRIVTKDRILNNKEMLLQEQLEQISAKIEEAKLKRMQLEEKAHSFWIASDKKDKGKGKGKSKDKGKSKGKGDKKEKADKKVKSGKGSKKENKKKGKDTQKIEEPVRELLPKTLSDLLEDIIAKLKTSSSYNFEHTKRLRQCYSLLCAYIDKICEDVQEFENCFGIERLLPKIRKTPYVEKMYEPKLDGTEIERPMFVELTKTYFQKAPEWTDNIPVENYMERYNAYHGIISGQASKGKSKTKDAKKVKEKKKPKEKKVKTAIKEKYSVTQEQLESQEAVEEEESIRDETISISSDISDHYENNIYLIFYTNLVKFVDDLVAVSELEQKPLIPANILQRIQYSQFDQMRVDGDLQVRVFDLKRVISNMLNMNIDPVKIKCELKLIPKYKPPEVVPSSSSVWNLLKAYYPKQKITQDYTKEEIYAVPLKPFPPETVDGETVMYTEDAILHRSAQTSICGSKTVCFLPKSEEKMVCKCKSIESEEEKSFSYHESRISSDSSSTGSVFKEDSDSCRNK